jgi:hypothetical protein
LEHQSAHGPNIFWRYSTFYYFQAIVLNSRRDSLNNKRAKGGKISNEVIVLPMFTPDEQESPLSQCLKGLSLFSSDPDWITDHIDYQLFMGLSTFLSIWWPLPETHVV